MGPKEAQLEVQQQRQNTLQLQRTSTRNEAGRPRTRQRRGDATRSSIREIVELLAESKPWMSESKKRFRLAVVFAVVLVVEGGGEYRDDWVVACRKYENQTDLSAKWAIVASRSDHQIKFKSLITWANDVNYRRTQKIVREYHI